MVAYLVFPHLTEHSNMLAQDTEPEKKTHMYDVIGRTKYIRNTLKSQFPFAYSSYLIYNIIIRYIFLYNVYIYDFIYNI